MRGEIFVGEIFNNWQLIITVSITYKNNIILYFESHQGYLWDPFFYYHNQKNFFHQLSLAFTKPILLFNVFAILPNKFKAKALYYLNGWLTLRPCLSSSKVLV